MNMVRILCFSIALLTTVGAPAAPLRVVTTTTDLAWLVRSLGGDAVAVQSIAKGAQDPHYIEARPSYMVAVSRADVVVAVGLDLEVGWLRLLLEGARNPKVLPGAEGFLDASQAIEPIEVPDRVDRSMGDLHPNGNPHYVLDPVRALQVADWLAERLGALAPSQADRFRQGARALHEQIEPRLESWSARLQVLGGRPVVTYHTTLDYFLERFGIPILGTLEPRPGVPPSPAYLMDLQRRMQEEHAAVVLFENLYPSGPGKRAAERTGVPLEVVPVMVGGEDGVDGLPALYERLVRAIEHAVEVQR